MDKELVFGHGIRDGEGDGHWYVSCYICMESTGSRLRVIRKSSQCLTGMGIAMGKSAWSVVVAIGLLVAVCYAACAQTGPAEKKEATVQASQEVKSSPAPQVDPLKEKERQLDGRRREIIQKLTTMHYPLKQAREKALAEDPELKALVKEIESKQAELEKKLQEKYPDIGKMTQERDALVKEEEKVRSQIMEILHKREAEKADNK